MVNAWKQELFENSKSFQLGIQAMLEYKYFISRQECVLPDFHDSLDEENTFALLVQIRNQYGIRYKLETVLKNEFGYDDGSVRFEQFCKNKGMTYRLVVI